MNVIGMKSKFCYARTSSLANSHRKYCNIFSNSTPIVPKTRLTDFWVYFDGNAKNGASRATTLKCGLLVHEMLALGLAYKT